MKWSTIAWKNTYPVFDKITAHPFIHELMQGTLPKEKFEFYIQQDAIYLAEFGKVMCGLAGKFQNTDYTHAFLGFASDTVEVEKTLHESFRKQFNVSKQSEPTPTCLLYISYMHSCLHTKPLSEALAAILPCFWIYMKVGDYIVAHQTKGQNPYQNWIDTYAGDDFAKAVNIAIAICDALADESTLEQRMEMTNAFVLATKMEWMFWNSAYKLEKWSI